MQLESSATEDEDRRRLLKMKKRRGTYFLQQMKPTLTTSRVGGGRWGKMGTGCPLRRARRRTAATGTATRLSSLFGMKGAAGARREQAREEDGGVRWGRGAHCVGRGGGRRRPATATRLFKMKPTLTTSSFRNKERGHGKAGTRAGGGSRGKMGTGCPLRRGGGGRRRPATATRLFKIQDVTDSDHLFFLLFGTI